MRHRAVPRFALLLLLAPAAPALAQSAIVLDGSLNGLTDDVTASGGPNYDIPDSVGVQVGGNLFHSFSLFNLATGDSATFTDDPNAGAPIGNVIARVTGGSVSHIDGILRSTIPNADLFFLNPAGVIFGGGSAIDVPGSFTVSTAHSLIYAGGAESLSTIVVANPVLRAAAPEAFGFLGGVPAADLEFVNPDPINAKHLAVPDGETFTAIGGNVRVVGVGERSQLEAFGGRVQVAAVGSVAVAVPLDLATWNVPAGSSTQLGEVHLEHAVLDTLPFDTAVPQGEVVIRGGRLTLSDRSTVRGGGMAGRTALDIAVAQEVTLDDSELRTEAQGGLAGGVMQVSATQISLANGSIVRTRVFDFGGFERGGDVFLKAGVVDLDASSIVSTTEGAGAAGNLSIVANQLALDSSAIAASGNTLGREGNISIGNGTGGSVTLRGTAQILTTDTLAAPIDPAEPRVGMIDIDVLGTVRVTDGAVIAADTLGANTGGDVSVSARTIEVTGGGLLPGGVVRDSAIETSAQGTGTGGAIHLSADDIRIASDGGPTAGAVRAFVRDGASGEGGDVDIDTTNLTLADGGQISTTTRGTGAAGAISIDAADQVLLIGETIVEGVARPSSISARSDTDADANSIAISARTISVEDGAQISARAAGAGRSGDVTLSASESITVQGAATQGSVVSSRSVDGPGGDLTVSAPTVEVLDGGSIDVSSSGAGSGGQLMANVGSLTVAGQSTSGIEAAVASEADGTGDARGIAITASGLVRVGRGGRISASSRGLGGSPGDIDIDARAIAVDGGQITAESGGGRGGNIALGALGDVTLDDGLITARSAASGDAGSISIAGRRVVAVGSQITADSPAFGGNVTIRASKLVHLVSSEINAFSRGGVNTQGLAGGNIFIDLPAVLLNQSTLNANGLGNANGGNIFIAADPLLVSSDSSITASSQFGTAGTIVTTSPNAQVAGELAALTDAFLDASAMLSEPCLAREEVSGTFTVRSMGAIRPPPDAALGIDAAGEGERCEAR